MLNLPLSAGHESHDCFLRPTHLFQPKGIFSGKLIRADGEVVDLTANNDVVNQGKNWALGDLFNTPNAITSWYIGLISSVGYSTLAATDTYQQINQSGNLWTEFQGYTDTNNSSNSTTRPVWTTNAPSAQTISNTTLALYGITSAGTANGVFIVGGATAAKTKGDFSSGPIMWATALFNQGPQTLNIGDQLQFSYSVGC